MIAFEPLALRGVTGALAAWTVGMNALVLWKGVKLRRQSNQIMWMYPLAVMTAAGTGLILRVLYTVQGLPLGPGDWASLLVMPLFAVAGFQGLKRIQEMEEKRDA